MCSVMVRRCSSTCSVWMRSLSDWWSPLCGRLIDAGCCTSGEACVPFLLRSSARRWRDRSTRENTLDILPCGFSSSPGALAKFDANEVEESDVEVDDNEEEEEVEEEREVEEVEGEMFIFNGADTAWGTDDAEKEVRALENDGLEDDGVTDPEEGGDDDDDVDEFEVEGFEDDEVEGFEFKDDGFEDDNVEC